MNKITHAFVAAGGYGSRMNDYMRSNKITSKSLVKINNHPIIQWLIQEVEGFVPRIIISANIEATVLELIRLFGQKEHVEILRNKASGPACYPENIMDKPFLFFYGHSLIPNKHIRRIINESNNQDIIVSGFSTSSENCPIVSEIQNGKSISKRWGKKGYKLKSKELFIEPPFILTPFVARTVSRVNKVGESKINPVIMSTLGRNIVVVKAHFPCEFHYQDELKGIEEFWSKESS